VSNATHPCTYTDVQYAMLRSLAAAYGHGWATEPDMPTAYPIEGAPWTQSFIAECYEAIGRRDRWEPWQYGISAPGETSSGAVSHTTMTGRVQWQVDPGGIVGIVICRPGESYSDVDREHFRSRVVLSARVEAGVIVEIRTPETRDHRIPDVYEARWSPEDGPRAEVRHGDALLEARAALVGRPAALVALASAGVLVTSLAGDETTVEPS
jgi:hypothetical protein